MAQLAVGFVGAAVGNAILPGIGGQVGWAIGAYVGGRLFGPKPPDVEGPRLSDLTSQAATEGTDMSLMWGNVRLPGTVIWVDKAKEIKEEEEIGGKGGDTATSTTYTYTRNFAISFGKAGDGNTVLLRRGWANKKLFYDATSGSGTVSTGLSFKFYDGTQTAADPVIESVVGAGNVPAYKKQVLLVGYAWDVTETGGRLPQIELELVTSGSDAVSVDTITTTSTNHANLGGMYYSRGTDSIWVSLAGNGGANLAKLIEIDPWTQSVATEVDMRQGGTCTIMPFSPNWQLNNETMAFVYENNTGGTDEYSVVDLTTNAQILATYTIGGNDQNLYKLAETETDVYVGYIISGSGPAFMKISKSNWTRTTISAPSGYAFTEGTGGIYIPNDGITFGTIVLIMRRTSDNAIVYATYDGSSFDTSSVDATYTTTNATFYYNPALGDDGYLYWPLLYNSKSWFVRTSTGGTYVDSIDLTAAGIQSNWSGVTGFPYIYYTPEDRSIYFFVAQYAHRYNIDTQSLDKFNTSTTMGNWAYYDPNTARMFGGFTNAGNATLYSTRLSTVTPSGYPVADILDDLSEMVDVTSGMRNWAPVTETVGGFLHTKQTTAAGDMQPLLTYSLADAVDTGWQITGVELGGSSVDTIETGTTVRGNRVKRTKPHDIRLPSLSQTQYVSSDGDMQPAMASHEWYTAPGQQVTQNSFTITLSDAEAVAFNQKFLQLSYNLERFEFNLPPMYMALEPGDPITLLDGTRVKLTQVNRGYNGVLECEAVKDNPADLSVDVETPGSAVDNASIIASSSARLQVIDTPLLRDVDLDHPGPYLAAFTYGDTDPGIAFYASPDNSAFTGVQTIGTEPTTGTCETVPSSVDWENWDTTNTIRITLKESGTLSSATNAEVLAGANAAIWGAPGRWEVVQWKTASLVSTDVYDLSDLLRGRRGTDGNIDSHAVDDWFIVISPTTVIRHSLQNADIGNDRYYKAVKAGQAIADVGSTTWTIGTNPLRPYSPINPAASNSGSDVDLDWNRRTRKGGSYGGTNSLTDNVGGPISEDSEEYDIEILDSTGAVLDTYTVTTNSRTMTAAELLADYTGIYSTAVPTVFWRVRQNSAVSGVVGFPTPDQTHYITTPAENIIDGLSPDRFWKLDEDIGPTAEDSSGNNQDGTYNNTPMLNQQTLTTVGSSVSFDSASAETVSANSSIVHGASTFSIVFFMNKDDTSADRVYEIQGGGQSFNISVNGVGTLTVAFPNTGGGTPTTTNVSTSSGAVSTSTTYAFALTFGAETGNNWMRVYLDGSQVASNNFGTDTLWLNGASTTTAYIAGGSSTWDGRLDCVAEWGSSKITTTNITDIAAANEKNF